MVTEGTVAPMSPRPHHLEVLAANKRRASMFLRRPLTLRNMQIGVETYVMSGSTLRAAVRIGDHGFIGRRCASAIVPLEIGHFALIAPEVAFVGGDHRFDVAGVPSSETGRDVLRGVVIHDDVWIGTRAILLDGVVVGEGCVIGAGSVVTRDIEPYSIAAGVPARPIGRRFNQSSDEDLHRASLDAYRRTRSLVDMSNVWTRPRDS